MKDPNNSRRRSSQTDHRGGPPDSEREGFDGAEIRGLRRARGLSLTELSVQVGLSVGYLSQIERNIAVPSVKALMAVARTLDVNVSWFFSGGQPGPDREKNRIVRRANRRRIRYRDGFVDELLSPNLEGPLELALTRMSPGVGSGEPYSYKGDIGGLVLRGTMELTIGNDTFELGEGDSFTFSALEPHSYKNMGDDEALVVFALTPPNY